MAQDIDAKMIEIAKTEKSIKASVPGTVCVFKKMH